MTKTYLWEKPGNYPPELLGLYDEEHSPDRFLFRKGIRLSDNDLIPIPLIKFKITKQQLRQYECLVNSSEVPVISNRLADLLIEFAGNDIQLCDVKIECINGELEGYKILNIPQTIKGIDHARSSCTKMKLVDRILQINRLFYLPGCMGEHNLAREAEYMGLLLVSQTLYDAFQNKKMTGVRLVEPDKYYG
ncbi:MAG: hypothetical protein Q7V63_04855 [Gammaproteobacteria bacterium]|nr:hypothetical protein [Gammaproteobacteria bacterium]